MLRPCIILFLLLSIIAAGPLFAQEVPKPEDDIPLLNEEQEERLDQAHEDASQWLIEKALWFDSFFDDENYSSEINKSRIKISLKAGYSEKDEFEFKPRASIRLRLPKLENRANLIISGSDDSEFDADETILTDLSLHKDSEDNQVKAGLQYFLREKKNTNISLSGGLSFDYLYVGLRYRRSRNISEWRYRFINDIRYYTDDGWEDKASMEFDRLLSESLLFRMGLAAEWFEEENGVPHSLTFRTYQLLSRKRAFEYELSAFFDTRPSYSMTDVQVRVKYRQRLYRDWLSLEIAPFVSFPEEDDRDANPGIVCKLDAIFGFSAEDTFESVFNL